MKSSLKKYTEANREAWNEVMPRHQKAAKERLDNAFMQPGHVNLSENELTVLDQISIKGSSIAHLCCNNGVELLSLKNLGANECIGFDIADLAIREAQERAQQCQIDCQYVRSDVYEIGPEYNNLFDIVYFSAGALGWMPDLKLLFAKAAELLRANGLLFIHEIHPVSEMLPFDDAEGDDILRIIEPYFKPEPYIEYGDLDYVGGTKYNSTKPQYWFVHTISDIQMSLIENQFAIEYFAEYETDRSDGHKRIEQAQAGIPLSYILIGRKIRHVNDPTPIMNALSERLADLTRVQSDFVQIANQLDPQKRNQAGVCGEWSPKEVVTHLVGWDQSLLTFITDNDNFVPPDDVEEFNRQSVQSREHLSWSDVMQEMEATFRDLQQAVADVHPEMKIYDRVGGWLAGRTEDYGLHRGQLAAWVT